jgi:hypothetical protein
MAGTSARNLDHFAQMLAPKAPQSVRAYDFGSSSANQKQYNSSTAPTYDLSTFGVKAGVFIGGGDRLADPTDAAATLSLLSPSGNIVYNQTIPAYGHGDFTWAVNGRERFFDQLLGLLNQHQAS